MIREAFVVVFFFTILPLEQLCLNISNWVYELNVPLVWTECMGMWVCEWVSVERFPSAFRFFPFSSVCILLFGWARTNDYTYNTHTHAIVCTVASALQAASTTKTDTWSETKNRSWTFDKNTHTRTHTHPMWRKKNWNRCIAWLA